MACSAALTGQHASSIQTAALRKRQLRSAVVSRMKSILCLLLFVLTLEPSALWVRYSDPHVIVFPVSPAALLRAAIPNNVNAHVMNVGSSVACWRKLGPNLGQQVGSSGWPALSASLVVWS